MLCTAEAWEAVVEEGDLVLVLVLGDSTAVAAGLEDVVEEEAAAEAEAEAEDLKPNASVIAL